MRLELVTWFFSIPTLTIVCSITIPAHSQCLEDQKSLLLQLKNSLQFYPNSSNTLVNWTQNKDCCQWNGVTCDPFGRVIGLDLNSESISGGVNKSSSLFGLKFLEKLNLAYNYFYAPFPTSLGALINLKYLNLSNSHFFGQIPMELSRLTRLEKLDLSTGSMFNILIEDPNLSTLFRNLSGLTELYLDGVHLMANRMDWGQAISSSLPNLQVLSLSGCLLSGPVDSSLQTLQDLSEINLSFNNLASPVPDFLANLPNLAILILREANLQGTFPDIIFQQVQTLETLDLAYNNLLNGSLPEFPQNLPLQNLWLQYTSFSGSLPDSIGNLRQLRSLEINNCHFSGPIPQSLANLSQLVNLDFSNNNFSGSIPSFEESKNLTLIDLSGNALNGPIPSFQGCKSLAFLELSDNDLTGPLPSTYFEGHPNLAFIGFEHNSFHGSIPSSLFSCPSLQRIRISNNQFSGTVQFESFYRLQNLEVLDLSNNNLSINASISDSILPSFPRLYSLRLVSCKLQKFPSVMSRWLFEDLDLSNNQIFGVIPSWIWHVSMGYLNLSCNSLSGLQQPFVSPIGGIIIIDLHSNQLRGEIPIIKAVYMDYSKNNFSSSIPADISNSIAMATFFSLSDNMLSGHIPPSICNGSQLEILNLSNNRLIGTIPQCLIEKGTTSLGVLNLQNNQLTGYITGTFSEGCTLRIIELNGNHLEGQVPKSVANCTNAEVLNLGANKLTGNFPCFLANLSSLRILVLRSNKFHGNIQCRGINDNIWPNLQIIDLASNNFNGILPSNFFSQRKAIMDEGNTQQDLYPLSFQRPGAFYKDSVIVIIKGEQRELENILTIYTTIDLSCNSFEGQIPDTVGELKYLFVLNLSHNALTGSIPSSFGNLTQLESLDLSWNKLGGSIPTTLASLTFLSFLNLSYNQLVGMIPTGTQLQSFPESSFEGNNGLCGAPLTASCKDAEPKLPALNCSQSNSDEDEIYWVYIAATLGYTIGFGVTVGLLLWRQCYYKPIDRVIVRILHNR